MSIKGEGEQKIEIKKTIVIDASPEVVFKAITDPEELTNWFPDQVILEPRTGGKMKFSFYKTNSEKCDMDSSRRNYSGIYSKQKNLIYMGTSRHTRLSKNSCNMGA
jgi:Activator of Hsp90 ATPase homolog 1-like protein